MLIRQSSGRTHPRDSEHGQSPIRGAESVKNGWNWTVALILTFILSQAGQVMASPEHPRLSCRSVRPLTGWNASETRAHLVLRAVIESNEQLRGADLSGAYEAGPTDVAVDKSYRARNPRYANLNRFGPPIEDAWHWFTPLLPKNLLAQTSEFEGFVRIMAEEDNFVETPQVVMLCQIIR